MARRVSRRAALLGAGVLGATCAVPSWAYAKPEKPAGTAVKLPSIPIGLRIAEQSDAGKKVAVVSDAFVAEQLAALAALFAAHDLAFHEETSRSSLAETAAKLETRSDRDDLAASMQAAVLNVFFVTSLRDVDDPRLHRMGVTWRNLKNLKKKYVIVAASARPTTLAHEIGHFLGNGHSSVKNNLMSYDRDGGEVFLDATQGRISRQTARVLFASGEFKAPKS